MSKTSKFSQVIMKMMDSVTLNESGDLVVIDEAGSNEAEELLSQLVVETARDWWVQLESAENSLADMKDEIGFAEMNADPSHAPIPDAAPVTPVNDSTLESLLGEEDFDLGEMLEDDEDFGPTDGDEDFDDMMRGDDMAGVGDDMPMGDEDGDMDAIGGDIADEFGGDDLGDSDFDFSFLDDADDLGDEFATPEDDMVGDELDMDDAPEDEFAAPEGDEFADVPA